MVGIVLLRFLTSGAGGSITTAPSDAQARAAASMLAALPPLPPSTTPTLPSGSPATTLRGMVRGLPPERQLVSRNGLRLWGGPFEPRRIAGTGFTRVDGPAAGFNLLPVPPWYQTMQPGVNEFAPVAAGDINGDGWPDVAVGTPYGVFLYLNLGGRFALQSIDFPSMRHWIITYVALVDLTGNPAGLPDLFFCAWKHDCHILVNQDGSFSGADQITLPLSGEVAVHAAAFADVEHDGRIDIVTGASTELEWNFYPRSDTLYLWHNLGGGRFRRQALPGSHGETLSLLFADLNGDGWPDLYVGNDFDEPDLVYLNHHGQLEPVPRAGSPFPYSTESTMSVDSGDIRNDGQPAIYEGAIAFGGISPDQLQAQRAPPGAACRASYTGDPTELQNCLALGEFQTAVVRSRDVTSVTECQHFTDPTKQRDCVAAGYLWNEAFVTLPDEGANRSAVQAECQRIPAALITLRDVCAEVPANPLDYGQSEKTLTNEMPQHRNTNLLFIPNGHGYQDVTTPWGVGFGGWSWNARFVDLTNDTWQDLFITQGTRLRFDNSSNILYRNLGGQRFADQTAAYGLQDDVPTGGSLFLDYAMDGRVDIITYPFALTPVVWRNDLPAGPGLQIALRDDRTANPAGIGARVVIRSPDGRLQMRDIKASGGYDSQDWTVAAFGLGNWSAVTTITVTWPDGSIQTLTGLALHAGRYTLERLPFAAVSSAPLGTATPGSTAEPCCFRRDQGAPVQPAFENLAPAEEPGRQR